MRCLPTILLVALCAMVLLASGLALACTTIVVGKDASAERCVLMAHNEDDGPPQVVLLNKVQAKLHEPGTLVTLASGARLEQVPRTAGFLWLHLPGQDYSESGLNEWGVCITSDNCPSREDRGDFTDGGIGPSLRRIVIERARTARQGVRLVGNLVEHFGYQASGRTYIIADTDEAWLVCLVQGRHWLAWRVPDDEVCVVANTYVVREVDVGDQDRVLASTDIVDYAVLRGWYEPERDGPFDFARAYADSGVAYNSANFGRQWSVLRRFASRAPDFGPDLPASVRPKRKVKAVDLMAALRDHHEGTEFHQPDSLTGDPHYGKPRTVCSPNTQTAFVAQLRKKGPRETSLAWWVCLSRPCTSCFVPFHYGVPDSPTGWRAGGPDQPDEYTWDAWAEPPFRPDSERAFATALNFRERVAEDYSGMAGTVRARLGATEKKALKRQKYIERKAGRVWENRPEEVAEILLEFSAAVHDSWLEAMTDAMSSR
ncbi:MAG: C69 family dipeptidase [Candidatus Eiseniibacteriota bacterium]|nr:MAG: C69 family dipeptidase [Candidatus Eisenbacteria bacterium]